MLAFGGPWLYFAKKHYQTNPKILSEYSKAISEIQQVMKSGKTIAASPIVPADEANFKATSQRIVDFEKYLAERTPDANVANNVSVSEQH
jgi:hypothetical protein